jgi:hypothetical protein
MCRKALRCLENSRTAKEALKNPSHDQSWFNLEIDLSSVLAAGFDAEAMESGHW